MKRLFSLILVLSVLALAGCGGETAEPSTTPTETTQAPTAEPTTEPITEPPTVPTEPETEPTTVPTEPAEPINPLTGETLEAESNSRVFAVTINNVPGALPHYGVYKADLYFEMFVNDFATRGLALFHDISEAEAVGSVRSLRFNFIDICQAYGGVVAHASGSETVLSALNGSGVPNISVESEKSDYYFRDQDRLNQGYAWEHTLFVKGAKLMEYAESKGISITQDPDKDYGLDFTEDATPAGGEDASKITIGFIHDGVRKNTIMNYDEESSKYHYNQYNKAMYDGQTGEKELFENVIVLLCQVTNQGVYHVADLDGSGEGYFACNGKLIPIKWIHENETDPFTYTLADGTPLELGVGSSYIAIAPLTSEITWE